LGKEAEVNMNDKEIIKNELDKFFRYETVRRILYFMFGNPTERYPIGLLADELNIARGSVQGHIKEMLENKMIYVDRKFGRVKEYKITPGWAEIMTILVRNIRSSIENGILRCPNPLCKYKIDVGSDQWTTSSAGNKEDVIECPNCRGKYEIEFWAWFLRKPEED
jgi:hypothetical protein